MERMSVQSRFSIQKSEQQEENNFENQHYNFLEDTDFKPVPQSITLLKTCLPNIISSLGTFVKNFASMFVANQLNDNNFVAGLGLGITIYNAMIQAMIMSLNMGLFTQSSHAQGAKNYRLVGILLQRAWVVDFAYIIFMLPIFLSISPILMYCNVDEQVAKIASDYIAYYIPFIGFNILFDSLKSYAWSSKHFKVAMHGQNIGYCLAPVYLYIFVHILQFKTIGFVIANGLCEMVGFLYIYFHIKNDLNQNKEQSDFYKTWIPWNRESWQINKCIQYIKVSAVMGAITYLEWFFYELLTVFVAFIGNENALAAHCSFTGGLTLFFFMTPQGISNTVNSFLGNVVGQGKHLIAKNLVKVASFSVFLFYIVFFILASLAKPFFVQYFATGEEMKGYFSIIYSAYLNMFFIFDSYQVVLGAILRCFEKQNYATLSFIFCYYCVGIPGAYFFMFYLEQGVFGVWLNETLIGCLVNICFIYKIKNLDFEQCCHNVAQSLKKYDQQDIELIKLDQQEHDLQDKLLQDQAEK